MLFTARMKPKCIHGDILIELSTSLKKANNTNKRAKGRAGEEGS